MPEPTSGPLALRRPSARLGFWLLGAAVALAHLLLSNKLAADRVGWGAGEAPPARIEVAFVRDLAAAKPPAAPAAPLAKAPPRLAAVSTVAQAASAPAVKASAPGGDGRPPPPELVAATPESPQPVADVAPEPLPRASAAQVAELPPSAGMAVPEPLPATAPAPAMPTTASTAAAPAMAAASAPVFDWPPSTRLSYKLLGNYRGPVEGTAQVDWLRQGQRYQVHLETSIGPVLSRHITSEGELTDQGLAPRRFDGEQKVLFRATRRWQLRFGPDEVVMSDGKVLPAMAGAQDEASQFVQLTWLFTTQPQRLKVGGAVEMPLAISRKMERWTYDVVGEETLRFPFGDVPSFHLKPRREATAGDLTPEIWIAPSLQYLPVRILIRDGSSNWIDLALERAPQQAAQR